MIRFLPPFFISTAFRHSSRSGAERPIYLHRVISVPGRARVTGLLSLVCLPGAAAFEVFLVTRRRPGSRFHGRRGLGKQRNKYTLKGVKLLSSGTMENAAEAGRISRTFYADVL